MTRQIAGAALRSTYGAARLRPECCLPDLIGCWLEVRCCKGMVLIPFRMLVDAKLARRRLRLGPGPRAWRPVDWLCQEVRGDLSARRMITLDGDSMLATLDPGGMVVGDTSRRAPSPPGLFVIWDGLGLVAKRLHYDDLSNPPKVQLISDNPKYVACERTVDEANVVGRIMGRWQRLG